MKKTALLMLFLVGCGSNPYTEVPDASINQNNNENQNLNVGVCGDGVLNSGEECDDGPENSDTRPGACRSNCRAAYCGDGVIDSGEECEETDMAGTTCQTLGHTKGALGCTDCMFDTSGCSTCGDGIAEGTDETAPGYETCDGTDLRGQDCISVGQAQGTLACSATCGWDVSGCVGTSAECGNGVVEPGEGCDDGNHDNTDGCPDGVGGTCQPAQCGDGFVWAGNEGCDDGNAFNGDDCPDGVNGTCEWSSCGDGHVHSQNEDCDPGSNPYCHADCRGVCGDGNLDLGFEVCDDGNNVDEGVCTADCQGECGDGIVDPGEVCDGDPGCRLDCTWAVCGNGTCDCGAETPSSCPSDCANAQSCCGASGPVGSATNCSSTPGHPNGQCCTDGLCVHYMTDASEVLNYPAGIPNCGACGNNCAPGQICSMGTCSNI
jgi:cysteine-rich repeat protein